MAPPPSWQAPFVLRREALGQSGFNWKRFSGETIDVLLVKNPRSDLMQAAEKEFTELTGIKVSSEQIPEQQQRQKAMIEFASGRPSFDVAHLSMHVQKRLSEKGNWIEDLRPIIADASMTTPDFDFDDFGKAGLRLLHRQADGKQNAIPTFVDYWILYYNKELFDAERRRLSEDDGRDRHRRGEAAPIRPRASAGFVSRGLKNANVPGLDQLDARAGHRHGLARTASC